MFWSKSSSTSKSYHAFAHLCQTAMLWVCACMLLIGCDKTKQVTRDQDKPSYQLPQDPNLPKLSDPRWRPSMPQLPSESRGQKPVTLRISRLDYPLDKNLDKALRYTKPATDINTTRMLKDNGLKMVLLPLSEFENFSKEIGQPLNVWRSNLHMSYDGTPLATTPQITRKLSVDVHDPQLPQTVTTDEGWFRLMLSVQQVKLGSVDLGIVPQHYLPKTSVKPRSAMDKIWDGTLFDNLKATVTLSSSHLLIICRTKRTTLAQYRDRNNIGLFDPEPGEDARKPENFSMGDVLLTYDLWHHPSQMVFVIARISGI